MTIHFDGRVFGPDAIRAMRLAYQDCCLQLGLPASDHPNNRLLAARIIEIAAQGERDPARLASETLKTPRMASMNQIRSWKDLTSIGRE